MIASDFNSIALMQNMKKILYSTFPTFFWISYFNWNA